MGLLPALSLKLRRYRGLMARLARNHTMRVVNSGRGGSGMVAVALGLMLFP
jgi:hypothetical protein